MSLDSLEPSSGSPYSQRRHGQDLQRQLEYRYSKPIKIMDYDHEPYSSSCPGSPYHIRKPTFDRHRLWEEDSAILNAYAPSSAEPKDDRGEHERDDSISQSNQQAFHDQDDLQLPITMRSSRSMQSLRNRRDPQHQGTRTIRAKRLINKIGERNVLFRNLPNRSIRFLRDFVTTLVEEQWRYTLTVFAVSFVGSWFLFAFLWYLVAYAHGDLEIDPETGERLGDGNQPCVEGATTFTGFLLFSIETQVSTGYGAKVPTEECPEAFFLLIVQLVFGLVVDAAMVGVMYAKMVRPPKKISEMKFSKRAVICQRDGKLCLVFRICDVKQQHAIETKVTAVMLEPRRTAEGEMIEKHERHLKLENAGRMLLLWPVTVCHVIDRESPLYDVSAKDLLDRKFEIVITLIGGTMTTGQINEARTSYLPTEIFWGHRFQNIINFDYRKRCFTAMNENMDEIEEVDTPLCSVRRLEEVVDEVQQLVQHDRQQDLDDDHHAHGDDNDSRVMAAAIAKMDLMTRNPSSFGQFSIENSEDDRSPPVQRSDKPKEPATIV